MFLNVVCLETFFLSVKEAWEIYFAKVFKMLVLGSIHLQAISIQVTIV